MTRRHVTLAAILAGLGAVAVLAIGPVSGGDAAGEPAVDFTDREMKRILAHSPLPALPPDPTNAVADDPAAARLGQFLFFETRYARQDTKSRVVEIT